jgi:acyl dehydratase
MGRFMGAMVTAVFLQCKKSNIPLIQVQLIRSFCDALENLDARIPGATADAILSPASKARGHTMSEQSAAQRVLADLQPRIGQEIHCSDWLLVSQQRINEFAQATSDHQWIHTDPLRAARESPWKTTIAHGYLTLSLYPMLRGLVDAGQPLFPGVTRVINYGLEKLRFPNAVKSGSRVRAHCVLLKVEEVTGGLQLTEQYTVEIEGESKPACVAEAIMRVYF